MSLQPLFTIIVSGYQNEPYLPQCLSSISRQTFDDFEAICYVEESTDNSLAICQEWAKRDSRFIVATGPKSGSGSATRNYGIDHAKGKYLVIIDGDDWVATDMLENISAKLNETGPLDIIAFTAKFFPPPQSATKSNSNTSITNFRETDAIPSQVFSGQEAIRRIKETDNSWVNAHNCLNIYRVAFLRENHLRQRDGLTMEDFEWFPRIYFVAQRVGYLNECFYFYRQNSNSISHQSSSKCIFDLAEHFHSLTTFLSSHSVPTDIQAIWNNQWLFAFFNLLYIWGTPSQKERKAILKIFFATQPQQVFWCFLFKGAWHRILALPLLWLASKGWHSPANLYFRKIYPTLEWRFRFLKN